MSEEQGLQAAFDGMARALIEVRQTLASTPNYTRDLAQILARLGEIEKKPALRTSEGALDAAAREGAEKGAAEAAASLRAAVAVLERVRTPESDRAASSWHWKAALCALVFVAGVAVSSAGWVALARSGLVSPPYLPGTAAGCVAAGGGVAKDANGRSYCAFFVSP